MASDFLWELWVNYFWPGMGMFASTYLLFAVGNVEIIFKEAYPECWKTYDICSEELLHSITYSEVGGVMLGMIVFGAIAAFFGRRVGTIGTAIVMSLGAWLITSSKGDSQEGTAAMYTIVLCIFGIGVGGRTKTCQYDVSVCVTIHPNP